MLLRTSCSFKIATAKRGRCSVFPCPRLSTNDPPLCANDDLADIQRPFRWRDWLQQATLPGQLGVETGRTTSHSRTREHCKMEASRKEQG